MKNESSKEVKKQSLLKTDVSGSAKAWMVLTKTQPKVYCANYPIFWSKDVAYREAEKFGGTVVRCEVRW